ncbi:MAG: FAD-dependent monooxygenase [Roseiflexaceae bacterium]|nr:FAD-dependent monooxygenase [Roseiflexaceae bacterium]
MSLLTQTFVPYRQAVVIGASVAGLVTARVLANHFDRVVLIERDRFPDGDGPRSGTPQGHHAHILLARGRELLDELFPGLQAELAAAGAPLMDFTGDVAQLAPVGWLMRAPSGLTTYAASRPLLETRLRARVLADSRITIREGCDVVGLLGDHNRQVVGVRVRNRPTEAGQHADDENLLAALVVDASGRSSRTPAWLHELGYPMPTETVVNSHLGYASAIFMPSAGFQTSWKGMYVQPAPPTDKRGGVIWPVEGGRWVVTLLGMGRDYPSTNEAAFLAFAKSLRTPLFYEALQQAERLSPITGFRATENRLRHYERMASWPDGFVVLGDAVSAFNPVYGQGMTVASMSAVLLDRCLAMQRRRLGDSALAQVSRHFQQQLARSNATAWTLATGPDLRAPDTEGTPPSWFDRMMYRYLDRVFVQATRDAEVVNRLFHVLHLSTSPSALFHPRMVAAALRGTPDMRVQPTTAPQG